jgi:hypothetical protein
MEPPRFATLGFAVSVDLALLEFDGPEGLGSVELVVADVVEFDRPVTVEFDRPVTVELEADMLGDARAKLALLGPADDVSPPPTGRVSDPPVSGVPLKLVVAEAARAVVAVLWGRAKIPIGLH